MAVDWTKPIQTQKGVAARLIGTVKHYACDRYVVAIDYDDYEVIGVCDEVGECHNQPAAGVTIVNAPEKIRGWLNIYESGSSLSPFSMDTAYHDEDDARRHASLGCIARICVEFEEGEGL